MSNSFIEEYHNAFSNELCDLLIEEFEKRKEHIRFTENEIRSDYALQLEAFESLTSLCDVVKGKLNHCWEQFARKYEIKNEFNYIMSPSIKLQKSVTGGGFTYWHHEQGSDPRMIGRFGVWMVYLNDDFEGGHTGFKHQHMSYKPRKGTCLIWPAGYTHRHRANPDLVGTKYILTGWFRYPTPDLEKYRVGRD